jgi:ATPase family AAA domain-containing protein 3A/B
MSGSAFDQFKPGDAVTEVKNLFSWANSRPRGMIILIDECETFLESRDTLNPKRIRVLNEFLAQTGSESKKFMLVFATNRPNVLDPAVLTRVVASVDVPLPTESEILQLLKQFLKKYLHEEASKSVGKKLESNNALGDEFLTRTSALMAKNNFSGRDVTSFVISVTSAAVASKDFSLDKATVDRIVLEQLTKKRTEEQYEIWRAKRRQIDDDVLSVVNSST